MIGITQHLTKDQLKARAARQNCGKRAAVTAPDPNLLLRPFPNVCEAP